MENLMARMRILTASEQATFDKPPLFDAEQRKQFFSFPQALLEAATTLRTPNSQMGFLLLCAYFKATQRFFLPHDFLKRDIEAVARQLDIEGKSFDPGDYTETTRLRHQKNILEFYGFGGFDNKAGSALATKKPIGLHQLSLRLEAPRLDCYATILSDQRVTGYYSPQNPSGLHPQKGLCRFISVRSFVQANRIRKRHEDADLWDLPQR